MVNLIKGAKRGRFLQHDPDPEVARCAAAVWAAGGNFTEIAQKSGCAVSTVAGIAYLETRWPRNETIDKIMTALGYTKSWVTPKGEALAPVTHEDMRKYLNQNTGGRRK